MTHNVFIYKCKDIVFTKNKYNIMKKEERKLVNFRFPLSVDNYLKRISSTNHTTSTDHLIKLILADKDINDISMIEKIIKKLEKLKLFSIKTTKSDNFELLFVDIKYDIDNKNDTEENTYPVFPNPNVFSYCSVLSEYIISYDEDIIESFKEYIYNQFIDLILELTNKKIENDKTGLCEKFNYKYDNTLDLVSNQRKIISKILNSSNFIAIDGRVGPAQYAIMNKFTFDFFYKEDANIIQKSVSEEDDVSYNIAGINVLLSEKLENGIILQGRRNSIDQPCVHLIINNDDVTIDDKNNEIKLKMKLVDVGFHPEKQYNQIKIDLSKMKKGDI